ncbi:hypothetical protein FG167_08775 [Lacinutrix sp. WUR7]|uniref:DUF6371 domain-containing protein n=1 Tax=Lacinutrix sp. WUR7 TaxID=2653681 RepID=UPI00193CEFBB|nr:DUF6371 domain-containing protein [Lacinutrix sp. WUR7]QRM89323.1 hypothetical protein FG167_08775 [Lacinutrix sp. WUR7]
MKDKYKYILDTSSKKYHCPNCNKKTFVRFMDSETKQYINNIDGRCDRESKCGYFKKPNVNKRITSIVSNCNTKRITPTYHNENVISTYGKDYKRNHFVTYLLKHFVPFDVKNAIKKYFIGTTSHWSGATVFWQVDQNMKVKAGKIMLYDCNTGKRVKKPFNHISWMHKKPQLNGFVLQQCLFGLHNLCDYNKGDTLCIVESEKTAIIMSMVFPSNLWLATGSKSNFKEEILQPVKEFKIIAYPDKSEYQNWLNKSKSMMGNGFNISCSSLLEGLDLEEGSDLVDFLF